MESRAQPQIGKVLIDVEEVLGEINRTIYGHMVEHVGRAIYDGVWVGENSTIPNDKGVRKDAISILQRLRAPVIRWPGGCFADTYHWQDGVGPREKRPKRWNLWWEQYENNTVGTDEFLYFCRQAKAEPYLSINVGTGDVKEALAWVEYCNSIKTLILRGFSQQNTLRDAIIAGSVLNHFNSRCREITMANISQAFNVLHAVGLSNGPRMILTPTFHVMEMYQRHQGARLMRSRVETPTYEIEEGGRKIAREAVNVSASLVGKRLLITAVNEDIGKDLEFDVRLSGGQVRSVTGRRLWSANVRDHNTFENPERLTPTTFKIAPKANELRLQLPAHSINAFELEL